MRVKFLPHIGRSFQGTNGSEVLSGFELVLMNIHSDDATEAQVKLNRLARIVGRLIDKLPEHERIEACGLESQLERVILPEKDKR